MEVGSYLQRYGGSEMKHKLKYAGMMLLVFLSGVVVASDSGIILSRKGEGK